MNTKQGYTEIIDNNTESKIGISVLLGIFVILQLVCAFWGNSLIPSSCNDLTLRSSLRGLLGTTIFSCIIFISYSVCNYKCRDVEKNDKGYDIVETRNRDLELPVILFILAIISTIISIVFLSQIMTELNSSNCENAIKNKADNYKTFLTVTIIATSLELIGLIFLVYWELKERNKGKPSSEQIIETKKKEIDKLFEEKNKARNVVNIKTTKEELRKQQEELKKQEEEKVAKEIQDYKEQKQVDFENKHNDQNTNNNSSGNQPRIKTENKRIRPFGRKFNRNIPPLDLPRGIFPIKQEKEFNYFPQKDSVDKDKGSFFNQDDGDQTEYYSADEDDVDDDSQLP